MKLEFNPDVKCRMHRDQVAATCPECYDRAERQRDVQDRREGKRLHAAYEAARQQRRAT